MESEKNVNKNNTNEEPEIILNVEQFEYSPIALAFREKVKSLYKKNPYSSIQCRKIASFGKKLQVKYGQQELHNYEAYCILIGSTPPKKPEKFDLKGEDSIEQFINSLTKEML